MRRDQISRYVWPIRLGFLAAIILIVYFTWVAAMLLAMIGVPIAFHYLIRWSRSKAKRADLDDRKLPIQDLALIFATAPCIWAALILASGNAHLEPQLAMVGIWLWFQFAFLAPILWLGRRVVLPGPNDAPKVGWFFTPWMLMALFMLFGGRRDVWRIAFSDPPAGQGWGLVASAALFSLYLLFRWRSRLNDLSQSLFTVPAHRPDSRWRFFILGFVFLPLVWGLLFVSLCVHWQVYLSGTSPDASWLAVRAIAFHQALVEFSVLAIAFAFPLGTLIVWYTLKFRMGATPEPWAWIGVFLPWALLLLAMGVDPGGWFAWVF